MAAMTEAIAFDTHRFVKNLTDHGFTEEQAEVLANEQVNLLNSNLSTKTDLEALRLSTKTDLEALRLSTKADIDASGGWPRAAPGAGRRRPVGHGGLRRDRGVLLAAALTRRLAPRSRAGWRGAVPPD